MPSRRARERAAARCVGGAVLERRQLFAPARAASDRRAAAPRARRRAGGPSGSGIAIASSYAWSTSAATRCQPKRCDVARRRRAIAARRSGSSPEIAQRLGQRLRISGRDEHAVDAVADDIAIAGDVGGDDRRARGERFGQHHAEALTAERRRAQDVGATASSKRLRSSSTLPSTLTPRGSSISGSSSAWMGRSRSARSGCARAALRRHAAAVADPCAPRPDRRTRSAAVVVGRTAQRAPRLRIDVHAVRDHPVMAAEEAPAGPRRRLRDGDPYAQAVEHRRAPSEVADPVGKPLLVGTCGTFPTTGSEVPSARTSRPAAPPARAHGRRRSPRSAAPGASSQPYRR